jgi:hypothetical protein
MFAPPLRALLLNVCGCTCCICLLAASPTPAPQRYLFIKLTYHNHTPDEYEPPYFHAVREDGIGHFSRRPFSM